MIFPRHLPTDESVNPLNPNPTKWSNTLKQFFGNSGVGT